jgi:hypothetical protein
MLVKRQDNELSTLNVTKLVYTGITRLNQSSHPNKAVVQIDVIRAALVY